MVLIVLAATIAVLRLKPQSANRSRSIAMAHVHFVLTVLMRVFLRVSHTLGIRDVGNIHFALTILMRVFLRTRGPEGLRDVRNVLKFLLPVAFFCWSMLSMVLSHGVLFVLRVSFVSASSAWCLGGFF
ncbi:hypothetical protein BDD12DRAFT_814611 [Trichophaea hybrida]|nr:hypothetical protein BDD12DRAFT_814611 [Trichophaea hybrida]